MIFRNKLVARIVGLSLGLLLFLIACSSEDKVVFSTESWNSCEQTKRYEMVDDLLESYELVNMNDVEIKSLLGEWDGRYDPDRDASNDDYYWEYFIRYDDWEGYEVLLIHFQNDIAVSVEKEFLSNL